MIGERAIETLARAGRVHVLKEQRTGIVVGPQEQGQPRPVRQIRGGFDHVEVEHLPELIGDRAGQVEHARGTPVKAERHRFVQRDADAGEVVRHGLGSWEGLRRQPKQGQENNKHRASYH